MFKFFKKHKEAKKMLEVGYNLVSKSRFTQLESWEVNMYVADAKILAFECMKLNLPNDSALLFLHIFLLSMIHDNENPYGSNGKDELQKLTVTIYDVDNFSHKSQTVVKELYKYYEKYS